MGRGSARMIKGAKNIMRIRDLENKGHKTLNAETRAKALLLVHIERSNQDTKWGEQNHSQQAWVGILGEEFGEYCQCVNETYLDNATKKHEGGYENILKELTHVAAVAVGAMESLMRNKDEL